MTTIKETTQKAKGFIRSYNYYKDKNNGENLYQIYKNFSDKKYKALVYCKELKQKLEGYSSCFCGHNSDYFTYAFLFKENNVTYLAYITYATDYKIKYEG